MSERCRSCGAPIFWAKNARTGRAAPIDAHPDTSGPIAVEADGTYRVLPADERHGRFPDAPRYTNHFQTCPQAKSWRRPA